MIIGHFSAPVYAHSGDMGVKHTAIYEITKTNATATYTWYNGDYSQSFPYHVTNASEMRVELAKPSDSNTELNITLGNLTRTGIYDNETEPNLGLGYYKLSDNLGFVAPTTWASLDLRLSALNFSTYHFQSPIKYQFGAAQFDAVNITFADSFQQSTLIYDLNTGVLYYANVVIGNFVLSFYITGLVPQEHDNLVSSTQSSPLPIFSSFFALSIIGILVQMEQREKQNIE